MSKPNLPPLPTADSPAMEEYADGWKTWPAQPDYYTVAQMTAYAEEAVRQALAAQVPVAWLNKDSLVRLSKPHVAGCAAAIENRPRGGFVPITIIPGFGNQET